ncbi:MAG: FkbM family methyltransferase [Deltaproteobacteria bacterium]
MTTAASFDPRLLDAFRDDNPLADEPNWHRRSDVIRVHQELAREALVNVPPYSEAFSGRGIVMVANGARYFANAWVAIHLLRRLGCRLPVQIWHFPGEVDAAMRDLVEPLDVECVNSAGVVKTLARPPRSLGNFELKVFATVHAPFREVLFLDADIVPVLDPAFLFDDPHYQATAAIFWPDYNRLPPDHPVWEICQVPYRDEPECQGGELVLDKSRCWRALNLTLHLNEHSDFYYSYLYSDKDTWHLAWHMAEARYAMPPGILTLDQTMCLFDFAGRRLFQHRVGCKWNLDGPNLRVAGFWHEDECLAALADLRSRWNGFPFSSTPILDSRKCEDTCPPVSKGRLSGVAPRFHPPVQPERPSQSDVAEPDVVASQCDPALLDATALPWTELDIAGFRLLVHSDPSGRQWDEILTREVLGEDIYRLRELKTSGATIGYCIDIGGHIGSAAVLIKSLWPDARIIAIEPDHGICRLLRWNTLAWPDIKCVAGAVTGAHAGHVPFRPYLLVCGWGNTGTGKLDPECDEATIPVPAWTLEELLIRFDFPRVDLLKLDCEASEAAILEEARRTGLLKKVRWIRGEWHGTDQRKAVVEALAQTHTVETTENGNIGLFFAALRGSGCHPRGGLPRPVREGRSPAGTIPRVLVPTSQDRTCGEFVMNTYD